MVPDSTPDNADYRALPPRVRLRSTMKPTYTICSPFAICSFGLLGTGLL